MAADSGCPFCKAVSFFRRRPIRRVIRGAQRRALLGVRQAVDARIAALSAKPGRSDKQVIVC